MDMREMAVAAIVRCVDIHLNTGPDDVCGGRAARLASAHRVIARNDNSLSSATIDAGWQAAIAAGLLTQAEYGALGLEG